MKKLLAVFLSVIILLSSCWCVFTTSASGSAKDYNLNTSWGLYKTGNAAYPSNLNGASIQNWMFSKDSNVKYGDSDSLKMNSSVQMATAATTLSGLTVGKTYTASFMYYIPSANQKGGTGYIFKAAVYKNAAPIVSGGLITDANYFVTEQQTVIEPTGKDSGQNPIWKEMKFEFVATAEAQHLGISFRFMGGGEDYGNFYFANIKVEPKLSSTAYTTAANWTAHMVGNASYATTIGGGASGNGAGWLYNESESVTYNGQKSIGFAYDGNNKTYATEITGLEEGKNYKLSLKYYTPTGLANGSQGFIFKAGVFAGGTELTNNYTVNSAGALSEVKKVTTVTGEMNGDPVFEELELTFTAEDEQYLTLSFLRQGAYTVYITDVKLEEVVDAPEGNYFTNTSNWTTYKCNNAAYTTTIGTGTAGNGADWIYYEDSTVLCNSKKSIGFNAYIANATAAAKITGLENNKKYKLTFKYYIPSDISAGSQGFIFKAGIYKKGATLTNGYTVDASKLLSSLHTETTTTGLDIDDKPVWREGELTFITREGEEQYFVLSFLFTGSPLIYFSNIEVADTGEKVHVYDHDCDPDCNVCGEPREIEHKYEWSVDSPADEDSTGLKHEECKVCHVKRNENTLIPISNYYIDASIWGAYRKNHASYPALLNGESLQKWLSSVNETVLFEGQKTLAVDVNASQKVLAAKLEALETMKKYKLTFKYYIPSTLNPGSAGYVFTAGVYEKDAPLAENYKVDPEYALSDIISVKNVTGLDASENPIWETIELTFDIIDEEDKYLALGFLHYGSGYVYISDVKIEDTGEEVHLYDNDCDTDCNVCGEIREIEHKYEWIIDSPADEDNTGLKHEECKVCHVKRNENTVIGKPRYYMDANLWGAYKTSNPKAYPSIIDGSSEHHWIYSVSHDVLYDGQTTLGMSMSAAKAVTAVKLSNLETRKKYKLTFKYYIPDTIVPSTQLFVFKAGVYKNNAELVNDYTVNSDYLISEMAVASDVTGEEGGNPVWKDVELTFITVAGEEQYLALSALYSGTGTIYIADVKVEDTGEKVHIYDHDCDTDCNECGELREIEHKYEWIIDTPATEDTVGYKHEECKVCHVKQNENTVIGKPRHYINENLWGAYKTTNSLYPSVIDGSSPHHWIYSVSHDVLYDGQTTLAVNPSASRAVTAVKLDTLKERVKYKLKFKYFIPDTIVPSNAGSIFTANIYKGGANLTSDAVVNYRFEEAEGVTVTEATGTDKKGMPVWKEIELTFITEPGEDRYLVLSCLYGGTGNFHIADLTFEDTKEVVHIYDNDCDTTCNDCNAVREITHYYGEPGEDWIIDVEPTENTIGYKHQECKVCGNKANENTILGKTRYYMNEQLWGAYKTGNKLYPEVIDGSSEHHWLYAVSDSVRYDDQKTLTLTPSIWKSITALKLENLEKGKKYQVSFKYYIPSSITSSSYGFILRAGVHKGGAKLVDEFNIEEKYELSELVKISSSTGKDYNGNYNWGEAKLVFTATSEQYLTLSALFSGTGNIQIADVKVVEGPKDYEKPDSWGLYSSGSKIDGTSNKKDAFFAENKTKPGNTAAIRFAKGTLAKAAAAKLTTLESGTKYKVSFKYFVPASHTAGNDGYIFKAGVYAKDAVVSANGSVADSKYQLAAPTYVTSASKAGEWKEVSFKFTATDEQYLVISAGYKGSGANYGNLYFADFVVEEVIKKYDLVEDFGLYGKGEVIDESSTKNDMIERDETVTYNGKASIKIGKKANGATLATKLEKLIFNKKYRLTFKYYIPTTVTNGKDGYIFKAGVYGDGATVSADGGVADSSYYIAAPSAVNAATGTKSNGEPNWQEMTLIFDADKVQYLGISLNFGGSGDIYITDVRIREVLPEKDYEDPLSWASYRNGSHTSINGGGIGSILSESEITFNNGLKSLKFNKENLATVATKLQDVDPGKKYAVAFKYYITSETAPGSGRFIFRGGIYKENAPLQYGILVSDEDYIVAKPSPVAEATGKDAKGNPVWEEFAITFVAPEEDVYLGISLQLKNAEGVSPYDPEYGLVYIDDFEFFEIGTANLGKPQKKYTVDFEDETANYVFSKAERFDIVTAKNEAGKNSRMLYYKPGQYASNVEFNKIKIYTDNDPNLTVPIKDDTVYKITYKYKIASGTPSPDWLSFYTSYDGKASNAKGYNVATAVKKDQWHTYETYYSPVAGQNYVSLSMQFGKISHGVWIDDITIEETDLNLFKGHTPGEVKYEVNFDDYSVPLDNPFLKIEKAPKRNGKVSNAIHIPKITAQQPVTLNNVSVSDRSERVFAIPVEPNTRYVWSFWAYTVKKKPTYFGFYYNYDSTNIYTNVLRYHEKNIKAGKWEKFTVELKTGEEQTMLYTWFNAGEATTEMWIDDIILEKMLPGTTSETDLFYCEDYFNNVGKKENHSDLLEAKSGVYEVDVKDNLVHTFSIIASGKGSVTLSLDGKNPMPVGATDAPEPTVQFDGTTKSTAINFYSGSTNKVYLIVDNVDNLKIDELMLFTSKSLNAAEVAMGYVDNPNIEYVKPEIIEFETK